MYTSQGQGCCREIKKKKRYLQVNLLNYYFKMQLVASSQEGRFPSLYLPSAAAMKNPCPVSSRTYFYKCEETDLLRPTSKVTHAKTEGGQQRHSLSLLCRISKKAIFQVKIMMKCCHPKALCVCV